MRRVLLSILFLLTTCSAFAQSQYPSYRAVKLVNGDSTNIGTIVDGTIFYNQVSEKFRFRVNGQWVSFSTSSGSPPSEILNEYFSGNGVQTAFVLSQAGTVIFAEVGGQVMEPGVNYNISGQTITFTAAPLLGQTIGIYYYTTVSFTSVARQFGAACSDLTTALTAGTNKGYFRIPQSFTVTSVRASLLTAQTSGTILTVDINKNGTTILSTKLTIDNNETTSVTAATPAVISTPSFTNDDIVTFDIDAVGSGGLGLIVWLIGY